MAAPHFPTWPALTPEDVGAVQRVLESSRLSLLSNPVVKEFEEAFAKLHGAKHCVALNSGTAAIHVALVAVGVGAGDEVIVPSHTYIGSASPVLYQGAVPVFADVDDVTFCLSPSSVEQLVSSRTKAIIAVHLNGSAAPLDAIRRLAQKRDCAVIEDVAQAVGGEFQGRRLGTYGEVSCFSFWEDKIITTGGEGGAIITDDDDIAVTARRVRQHGEELCSDTGLYSSRSIGNNYRLTAMQAALGLSQLRRLSNFISARRDHADRLSQGLRYVEGLITPTACANCSHVFWKYVCRIDRQKIAVPIHEVVSSLQAVGVPAYRRYPVPLHKQPVFVGVGRGHASCPVSDSLADELFSLPVHPALSAEHIEYMIESVRRVFDGAVSR